MEILHKEVGRYVDEVDYELSAVQDGNEVGILKYSQMDSRIVVTWVYVESFCRRQGIATSMYRALAEMYPEQPFYSRSRTYDGNQLRKTLDERISGIKPLDTATGSP